MTKEQLNQIKAQIIEEENGKHLSALPPEQIIPLCCSGDTSIQYCWTDYYINKTPLQLTICWILDHLWWNYPDHHEAMSTLWPSIQPVLKKAEYTAVRTIDMGDYNPGRTQLDCLTYLYRSLYAEFTGPKWDDDDRAKIGTALLQFNALDDSKPATLFNFMAEHWQYLSHTLHPEHVYEALLLTTSPITDTPKIRREIRHSVNEFIKGNHKHK